MAEEEPKQAENQDETPPVVVPSHAPLPLPPDVQYSRPVSGRIAASRPSSGATGVGSSEPSEEPARLASHGAGLAAGITFATSIIAGALIGNWIDGRWNHSPMPWGTMAMTLIGAAAGFTNMMRILNRSDRKK